jgi:hypothetical protein
MAGQSQSPTGSLAFTSTFPYMKVNPLADLKQKKGYWFAILRNGVHLAVSIAFVQWCALILRCIQYVEKEAKGM